jgi:hypothetical protein
MTGSLIGVSRIALTEVGGWGANRREKPPYHGLAGRHSPAVGVPIHSSARTETIPSHLVATASHYALARSTACRRHGQGAPVGA